MYKKVFGVLIVLLLLVISSHRTIAADLEISWLQNSESDLAGYNLYYGTTSGQYSTRVDAGNKLLTILSDLTDKVEYYFALTAYDTAGNESGYSREVICMLNDKTPLVIDSVKALSAFDILVFFNKKVDAVTSQDMNNYLIDGIDISKAILLENYKTVRLVTEEHVFDHTYELSVDHIKDISLPANMIAPQTITYHISEQELDYTQPFIILVQAVSHSEVNVYFNKAISSVSSLNSQNYSIDNGITVYSVEQKVPNMVNLETSIHNQNELYSLSVKNITDNTNNQNSIVENSVFHYSWAPGDITGPMVSLVNVPVQGQIEVMFNEPVTRESAENPANYNISDGIQIYSAQLEPGSQIVTLNTSEQSVNKVYSLTINNIADKSSAKNVNIPDQKSYFIYKIPDNNSPVIKSVYLIDKTHVHVFFNEKLEESSAENIENYFITPNTTVLSAVLGITDDFVILQTTPHDLSRFYALTVKDVGDNSFNWNKIKDPISFKYGGQEAAQAGILINRIDILNETTIDVYFNALPNAGAAENINNYMIDDGVRVISAHLTADENRVALTTTQHIPYKQYTLSTVNIVAQNAGSNTAPVNALQYFFNGEDIIGPLIIQVKPVDFENIDILFNEALNQETAENIANYQFNADITVLEAKLDFGRQIVHLHTSRQLCYHPYTLSVKNICDNAQPGNKCDATTLYSYIIDHVDDVPPVVKMITVINPETINVHFSEPVEFSYGFGVNNFVIDNNIDVLSVGKAEADNVVKLNTTLLSPGIIYTLQVSNVSDYAGNSEFDKEGIAFNYSPGAGNNAPAISKVTLADAQTVQLQFADKADKVTAGTSGNYQIYSDIEIMDMQVSDPRNVVLNTSIHDPKTGYILETTKIKPAAFTGYNKTDIIPFYYYTGNLNNEDILIENITMLGPGLITIKFNMPVSKTDAENLQNYIIKPGPVIYSAVLDNSQTIVTLQTSNHIEGFPYIVQVSGLESLGGGKRNDVYGIYSYFPSLQFTVTGMSKIAVDNLDVGKKYYTDRNYITTSVPEEIKNCKMIMTPNNDKDQDEQEYLAMQLTGDALVYIAYDPRASVVPKWLQNNFIKTDLAVGVSDPAGKLDLWKGIFEPGTLSLGGNLADGAAQVRSMYFIVIKEPTVDAMREFNTPGEPASEAKMANTFELHQNYPNPFNPSTTISFYLGEAKAVKLEIFNILGQKVKTLVDAHIDAGAHEIIWDGRDQYDTLVSSGTYFYRIFIGNDRLSNVSANNAEKTVTRKMMFLR